mmetsp:Transcript_19620/g.40371  ORF Transcript_19620/g.40371 Transcript_19620/m.40371 type:complete len:244 (-) Transcript_19620:226-957(-)
MNKIGDTVVDNLVELSRKGFDGLIFLLLRCLQGIDKFQHVWMATGQSLANNLETSSHNVGSLDGNGNWQTHVCVSHEIVVTPTDCSTARNVHSMLHNSATTLCAVLLHNRGHHHWCLVVVNNGVHQICSGNSDESITSSLGQGFLNTSKFGNWHPELFANPRVGSNRTDDLASTPSRTSWQTHTSSFGKAFHKHVPSETTTFLASQNIVHGDPHIVSFDGTIHKCGIKRHVSFSHVQSWMIAF